MDTDIVKCENCGKEVQQASIGTHIGYCLKNINPCPQCKEPIDKRDLMRHIEEAHDSEKCKYCKRPILIRKRQEHEQKLCAERPILCSFCSTNVPYKEYSTHQEDCASRTVICEHCSSPIALRNKDFHDVVCSGKDDPEVEKMANLFTEDIPERGSRSHLNRARTQQLDEQAMLNQAIMESIKMSRPAK